MVSALAGTAGPGAAAALAVRGKPEERAELRARVRRLRAPLRAYAAALLIPPAVSEAGARLASRRLGLPARVTPALVAETVAVAGSAGLIGGPLGEEPGWRGYALPRLEAGLGRRRAALVLGAAWAVWHVPLLLGVPEQRFGVPARRYLPAFLVAITGHSAFQSWLAAVSGGSVPVAVLGHSSYNASTLVLIGEGHPGLLDNPGVTVRALWAFAGAWALAGGVALWALPSEISVPAEEPGP